MTYFFGVLEKSDFSQFENLESLQAANIENIKALAEANGVGVEEFLLEALLKGEQEWKYNTLVPETDYVFYAYGLSTELEILTTVNTYEFKTLVVEQVEVNFKITASDVTPTSFTLNVEPTERIAYIITTFFSLPYIWITVEVIRQIYRLLSRTILQSGKNRAVCDLHVAGIHC